VSARRSEDGWFAICSFSFWFLPASRVRATDRVILSSSSSLRAGRVVVVVERGFCLGWNGSARKGVRTEFVVVWIGRKAAVDVASMLMMDIAVSIIMLRIDDGIIAPLVKNISTTTSVAFLSYGV